MAKVLLFCTICHIFGVLNTNPCVAIFLNDVFSGCHGNGLFSLKWHVFFIVHHKTCCKHQNMSHEHMPLNESHGYLPQFNGCHGNSFSKIMINFMKKHKSETKFNFVGAISPILGLLNTNPRVAIFIKRCLQALPWQQMFLKEHVFFIKHHKTCSKI